MVPTSLLGRVKLGGASNSLMYPYYFLFIAASLIIYKVGVGSSSNNAKKIAGMVRVAVAELLILVIYVKAPLIFALNPTFATGHEKSPFSGFRSM